MGSRSGPELEDLCTTHTVSIACTLPTNHHRVQDTTIHTAKGRVERNKISGKVGGSPMFVISHKATHMVAT